VTEPRVLVDNLAFPESPRWYRGRLWFCDWGEREIIGVDLQGQGKVVVRVESFPLVVTPDNSTLIVAESHGGRLSAFEIALDGSLSDRRTWADLDGGAPDGICLDAEGAVWYGDVPNRRCVRVAEGGEVLQTIDLDRGCFACMLGGTRGTTLFLTTNDWRGPASIAAGARAGQVLTVDAPARHAGRP
jgi:sugar lactone lactonase YvrE